LVLLCLTLAVAGLPLSNARRLALPARIAASIALAARFCATLLLLLAVLLW
jgi:hypothetical protein